MESVLDGFVRYRRAVIDRNQNISENEIVWAYQVMELENGIPASKALRDFIDSPEGAYLSVQDKDFLDRLEAQIKRQLQGRYDALAADDDAGKLPARWDNAELLQIYCRLESIRQFCRSLDTSAVERIVKDIAAELAADDRAALVLAYKAESASKAEALRTTEQTTRWLAVLRHVPRILEGVRPGFAGRPEAERRVLELVVNQSLFFSPFLFDNAAVQNIRFNDFAEAERRRLDQMVRDAVRKLN